MFAGKVVGGELHFQRRECLDVKFRDPKRMKSGDLAFDSDRRALEAWEKLKERHQELRKRPAAQPLSSLRELVGSPAPGTAP